MFGQRFQFLLQVFAPFPLKAVLAFGVASYFAQVLKHRGGHQFVAAGHWTPESRKSAAVLVPYETLYQTVSELNENDAAEAAAEVAYFKALGDPQYKTQN